jgi:hypothetical protein
MVKMHMVTNYKLGTSNQYRKSPPIADTMILSNLIYRYEEVMDSKPEGNN